MRFEYHELEIWKKSIEVVKEVYRFTKTMPDEEKFGMISQMRRASVSISSNIAEGKARATGKDFRNFLYHAFASSAELETQLCICHELKIGNQQILELLRQMIWEEMAMIKSFISKMNT